MTQKETHQFALRIGLLFAAYCIFRFLSMIQGLNNEAFSGLFTIMTIFLPFVLYFLLKKTYIRDLNSELSFRSMTFFSLSAIIYSQIVLKSVEYLFFNFVSPNMLSNMYARSTEALLSIDGFKQMGEIVQGSQLPSLSQYLLSNFSLNILIYLPIIVLFSYLISRKRNNPLV